MKKNPLKIRKFIDDVLAIENEDALSSGHVGYMIRAMVMTTLPHSKPDEMFFQRKNGLFTLSMTANPKYGLPYGALPRILLAWLATEAVRRKSLVLELGETLSAFLRALNLSRQGGARGDITRLREQMLRLFTSHISYNYQDSKNGYAKGENFLIARSYELWWNPLETKSNNVLSKSCITLSRDFFEELVETPVPVDIRVLQALRRSPLQMDIYQWLTYRFSYFKQGKTISWSILKNQFGSDYADNAHGLRNFKAKFLDALNTVLTVYSTANVQVQNDGLKLYPSPSHIKKQLKKTNVSC